MIETEKLGLTIGQRITVKQFLESILKAGKQNFVEQELKPVLLQFVAGVVNTECPHCKVIYNEITEYDIDRFIEKIKNETALSE